MSAKDQIIQVLKAQVYDQIAIKEKAEEQIRQLNEKIMFVNNQPESAVTEEVQKNFEQDNLETENT